MVLYFIFVNRLPFTVPSASVLPFVMRCFFTILVFLSTIISPRLPVAVSCQYARTAL